MAFAVDDVVLVTPGDKKHPSLGGNGFGQILDTNVNGKATFYRVAIGGVNGFVFVMDENELTAVPAGTTVPHRVTNTLPPKKGKNNH